MSRRISQMGVAGWPVTGRRRRAFSTLLRRPGLRASNGGVLATTRTQNVSEYMLVLAVYLVDLVMVDTRKFFHDCNCIFTYAYRTLFFTIT